MVLLRPPPERLHSNWNTQCKQWPMSAAFDADTGRPRITFTTHDYYWRFGRNLVTKDNEYLPCSYAGSRHKHAGRRIQRCLSCRRITPAQLHCMTATTILGPFCRLVDCQSGKSNRRSEQARVMPPAALIISGFKKQQPWLREKHQGFSAPLILLHKVGMGGDPDFLLSRIDSSVRSTSLIIYMQCDYSGKMLHPRIRNHFKTRQNTFSTPLAARAWGKSERR